jgi:hypothetical protein
LPKPFFAQSRLWRSWTKFQQCLAAQASREELKYKDGHDRNAVEQNEKQVSE